jgi:hypothetical protein
MASTCGASTDATVARQTTTSAGRPVNYAVSVEHADAVEVGE